MATKKNVAQSEKSKTQPPASTKRSTKAPAQVLREQKAVIEEALNSEPPPPPMPAGRHPASDAAEAMGKARDTIGGMQVPMTLSEICSMIGVNCSPERFAVTALESFAGQVDALSTLCEKEEIAPFQAFLLMRNVSQRIELASRVTAWLESEQPSDTLPEVQP